jgi:hypothetical protein
MVLSKLIISTAITLLTAQMATADDVSGMLEGDLTFAPAPPPRGPEASAWLASKSAKAATKTSNRSHTRRTAEAELDVSESLSGDVDGGEYSVPLVQPAEIVTSTPVSAAEAVVTDDSHAGYKRASPTVTMSTSSLMPSEVVQGEIAWWNAAKTAFGLASRDTENPKPKYGRIIAKSRTVVDEDASPFQEVGEDPGDGLWGKRGRPGGGSGRGSMPDQSAGEGQGRSHGQGQRPGSDSGSGRSNGPDNGGPRAGSANGGHAGQGPAMKRYAPFHGPDSGTSEHAGRPAWAPSAVKPTGARPPGPKATGAGNYSGPRPAGR